MFVTDVPSGPCVLVIRGILTHLRRAAFVGPVGGGESRRHYERASQPHLTGVQLLSSPVPSPLLASNPSLRVLPTPCTACRRRERNIPLTMNTQHGLPGELQTHDEEPQCPTALKTAVWCVRCVCVCVCVSFEGIIPEAKATNSKRQGRTAHWAFTHAQNNGTCASFLLQWSTWSHCSEVQRFQLCLYGTTWEAKHLLQGNIVVLSVNFPHR